MSVGLRAVGPVKLDLLARGVEAGRIPLDAFVRHEAWTVWRPLNELSGAPAQAEDAEDTRRTDDIAAQAAFAPNETREALLLLMTAAVARVHADAAIVRQIGEDGAVVIGAHGPPEAGAREWIGLTTRLDDPALQAAARGETIHTRGRFADLVTDLEGGLLVAVCVAGGVVAVLELGRRSPFNEAETASVTALANALEDKLAGVDGGCPL